MRRNSSHATGSAFANFARNARAVPLVRYTHSRGAQPAQTPQPLRVGAGAGRVMDDLDVDSNNTSPVGGAPAKSVAASGGSCSFTPIAAAQPGAFNTPSPHNISAAESFTSNAPSPTHPLFTPARPGNNGSFSFPAGYPSTPSVDGAVDDGSFSAWQTGALNEDSQLTVPSQGAAAAASSAPQLTQQQSQQQQQHRDDAAGPGAGPTVPPTPRPHAKYRANNTVPALLRGAFVPVAPKSRRIATKQRGTGSRRPVVFPTVEFLDSDQEKDIADGWAAAAASAMQLEEQEQTQLPVQHNNVPFLRTSTGNGGHRATLSDEGMDSGSDGSFVLDNSDA